MMSHEQVAEKAEADAKIESQAMPVGQELVEAPTTAIRRFSEFDQQLADFKEMNSKMVFDIETYEGETECKKYLARVGKLRTGVEGLRKSLKKKSLEEGRSIDTDAKEYQAEIAAIDAVHSVPLKDLETKRINEALAIQEAIKEKARKADEAREADLKAREAKMAAKEAEQEAAEREEELLKARLDAAEVTKRQAEQAAVLAKGVAEQEKINAVAEVKRKAKAEADALAKKASDLYEKEQAEQRKIDADILARQQDVEHRKNYNVAAVNALKDIIGDSKVSESVVIAIVKGQIPNVTMNY